MTIYIRSNNRNENNSIMKKNNNTQRRLPAAALLMAVALLLTTSCSRDDAGDNPAPGDFAPGTVPITFAAAAVATPHAAKSPTSCTPPPGTAAGQWTKDDWVTVEVDGVAKRYRIADDGTTTRLVPADAANTHYWASPAQTVSVRAWYSGGGNYRDALPESGKTPWGVDMDQRDPPDDMRPGYQRSDFLYAPARTVSYADARQGAVQGLTFYHQTSRVVVRLRKGGAVTDETVGKFLVELGETGEGNMFASGIMDETTLPIDPSRGRYSAMTAFESGQKSSIIPREILPTPAGYARCFEALVIPQDMSGKAFVRLWLPDFVDIKEYIYRPDPGEGLLRGGYTHTYDVTVSPYGQLHVTTAGPIAGWEDGGGGSGTAVEEITPIDLDRLNTINDNRTYRLTGTKDAPNDKLILITGGTPTIIVEDADITCLEPIRITGGTPEIRVVGMNNRIKSTECPGIWLDGVNANVRITGDGPAKSGLTVQEGTGTEGAPPSIGSFIACGDISIEDIKLSAQGGDSPIVTSTRAMVTAPAIGIGADTYVDNRKCGRIILDRCDLELTPGPGSPSIGFGCNPAAKATSTHEIDGIIITHCTIKSTISKAEDGLFPAHILGASAGAGTYHVGASAVKITPPTRVDGRTFFKDFRKNEGAHADGDIIIGFPALAGTPESLDGYGIRWEPWQVLPTVFSRFVLWKDALGLPGGI